jgi:hypothetical protein
MASSAINGGAKNKVINIISDGSFDIGISSLNRVVH